MQILATTVLQAATGFLHPGYMSAYPRPWHGGAAPGALNLDVAEALRLQHPGPPPDLAPGSVLFDLAPGSEAGLVDPSLGVPFLVAGVVVLFGALLLLALYRRGSPHVARVGRGYIALGVPATVVLVASLLRHAAAEERRSHGVLRFGRPAPPSKAYARPRQATQVILYGLIADAATNLRSRATHQGALRPEIALPTPHKTPGMRHALRHYGHDGWGRALRFAVAPPSRAEHEERAEWLYTITSAGPDGRFGTRDDLRLHVAHPQDSDWDQVPRPLYLRRIRGALHVFLHRWSGALFRYHHELRGWRLSGSKLYDVLVGRELGGRWGAERQKRAALESLYARMARGEHGPRLILMVSR